MVIFEAFTGQKTSWWDDKNVISFLGKKQLAKPNNSLSKDMHLK